MNKVINIQDKFNTIDKLNELFTKNNNQNISD